VVHARAYTECTPAGIRTRGLAGTRECRWEEVADIVAQPYRGAAFIMVVTRSGRRFRLGAPVEGGVMGDPQLPAKMAEIRQYWQSAVAAAGRSAPA
jgi:Bacterial PH domain